MHILYIQKAKKSNSFYTQKTRHFVTIKTIYVTFYIFKKQDTLRSAIFHEISEVVIYKQKAWHFALHDVLYTKIQTLQKKEDNLRYVFIYKNMDTLRKTVS